MKPVPDRWWRQKAGDWPLWLYPLDAVVFGVLYGLMLAYGLLPGFLSALAAIALWVPIFIMSEWVAWKVTWGPRAGANTR